MASITKDILFYVFKFLEKMVFQLMFEIIKWIQQLQVYQETVSNYWYQIGQFFFCPEHLFLIGCSSFKTEDLVFTWFWPDCLYMSWKSRGQVLFKSLKALEQRYWLNLSETRNQLVLSKSFIPMWLLLSSWRKYLIHLFWTVCNLFLSFLFRFGYQAEQT